MASILDRYGIKEVADITFYKIGDNGKPLYPVLYLDTAKTSTIEVTAETADARGGKGNPKLISWDFGKEITVTLEDALFSAKSMAIMFGDGTLKDFNSTSATTTALGTADLIMKTENFKASIAQSSADASAAKAVGWSEDFVSPDGNKHEKINPKFYNPDGTVATSFVKDETYFCSYDLKAKGSVIEVSANSFPGTYYVTGDTFARSEVTGDDEFFQFVIPKAKVTSENTITLEAEGDPSVFSMNLTVLRPSDGVMMRLVKYELDAGTAISGNTSANLVHNHVLNVATEG